MKGTRLVKEKHSEIRYLQLFGLNYRHTGTQQYLHQLKPVTTS